MMDAYISPATRDYVLQNGMPQRDPADGLANAVYLRLMTPLGSWWQDADFGSKLHLLVRQKDLKRVAPMAKQWAQQALQPILDDGRATAIEIETEQLHDGRLNLLIIVTDAADRRLTFQYPIEVY